MAIAEPTEPTPMMPIFMVLPSAPSMFPGLLMCNKGVLA